MRAVLVRLRPRAESSIPSLRRFFAPFCSPSSGDSSPRVSNSFLEEPEGSSGVYRHTLKFQRPTTVKWRPELRNSASFIGTLVRPLTPIGSENEEIRAYTFLRVSNSPVSRESFVMLLQMRDKTAEMCSKHLKENDFIYVSGQLRTSIKADQNGSLRLLFNVIVKELNYVTGMRGSNSQSGELTGLERYKNRLNLWQVFFSSPYEWWDNRKDKLNPKHPDFKHKDTGEALWLTPNDPPWIKKQLQILDAKMADLGQIDRRSRHSRVSKWEYDD